MMMKQAVVQMVNIQLSSSELFSGLEGGGVHWNEHIMLL